MDYQSDYGKFKKLSTEELADIICGSKEVTSKSSIARFIYDQRQMEQQDKYTKEQIELQHKRNTELVEKQGKWIKFSAILTAISTLTAAIAGVCLSYMLTRPSQQQTTKTETQQETAQSTKNKTLETRPEQKPYKVPLSPPK